MKNNIVKQSVRAISAAERKRRYMQKECYGIRACLGCTWAWFYCLLGGREAGKSYSVTEFFVRQWKKHGIPFTWLRLNEASMKKMLANNAEKLVDADIYRKYGLKLSVKVPETFCILTFSKPFVSNISLAVSYPVFPLLTSYTLYFL